MGKKGEEGIFEFFLKLFMPVWLPLKGIRMMIEEIMEERRKKREREK